MFEMTLDVQIFGRDKVANIRVGSFPHGPRMNSYRVWRNASDIAMPAVMATLSDRAAPNIGSLT